MLWQKAETILAALFIFSLPFETRVVLFTPLGRASDPFNEWQSVFLYASDILFIAVFIFGCFSLSKKKFSASRPMIFLGAFFLLVAMSAALGDASATSWYRVIKVAEGMLVFYYAAVRLPRIFSFRTTARILVGTGVLQSIIALGQFFKQASLGLWVFRESPLVVGQDNVAQIVAGGAHMIRAYGTMPSPNVLAGFLGVALFFLFALFVSAKGRLEKGALLIAQFFILGGVFVTFSRGVILLFFIVSFAALAVLYFYKNFEDRRALRIVSISYILYSIFYILILFPELTSRAASSFASQDTALSGRIFFNFVALQAIVQHPWWGVGPGNFIAFFRESFPFMRDLFYQPAHNVFLLIAAESGIPVLVAFIIFISATIGSSARNFITRVRHAVPHASPIPAFYILNSVFFILVISMYDHFFWTIQQTYFLFWLVLGLGLGNACKERKINASRS